VADIDSIISYLDVLEEREQGSKSDSKINDQIINSSLGKKQTIPPTLTSAEKSRLRNKMDIVVESFYRLRKKYEKDEKGKTAVAATAQRADAANKQASEAEGKKAKKGILGLLTSLFGLLSFFGKPLLRFLSQRLSGLLKTLSKTISKGLAVLRRMVGRLLGSMRQLLSRGIRAVGNLFRNVFKGFKNSSVFKGFAAALEKGKSFAKGIFNAAKNKIVGALKAVGNFFGNALKKIPGISQLFPALGKAATAGAAGAGVSAVTQSAKKPNIFQRIGGGIKSTVQAGGRMIAKGAGAVGRLAGAPLRAAWGGVTNWFKGPGKKLFGGILKRIPLIGSIIEGVFASYDIKKFAKDPAGSMADLEQQIGKRVIEGMGGVALGTAVGAALTPVLGPIGTFLGFLGGDVIGRKVGGIVSNAFGARPFGRMVLNAFPNLIPEEARATMQDFIVQKGTVMPFSSQDEVMGMKPGGAISQFLRDTGMSKEIASLQKTTNNYLAQLVQLTKALVQKPGGGGGPIPNVPLPRSNEMQGDLSGPIFSDNRADFTNSTYHMA